MENLLIIDADSIIYLASYKKDNMEYVIEYLDDMVNTMLEETNSNHYILVVGGKNNFRYIIRRDYKANRKYSEKPLLFYETKQYMIDALGAFVCDGNESDDVVVATANYVRDNELYNPIIAAIDKDIGVKPNTIYRWASGRWDKDTEEYIVTRHSELFTVSEHDAFVNTVSQLITGDSTDNIKVCKGMGKAKVAKLMAGKSHYDMIRVLIATYKKYYGSRWKWKLTETYHLINLVDDYNVVDVPKKYKFKL